MTRQRKQLIAAGAIAIVVVAVSVFAGVSASILLFISLVMAMMFMLGGHGGHGGHGGCGGGSEPSDHVHLNAIEDRPYSHGDTSRRCAQAGEDATNKTEVWLGDALDGPVMACAVRAEHIR